MDSLVVVACEFRVCREGNLNRSISSINVQSADHQQNTQAADIGVSNWKNICYFQYWEWSSFVNRALTARWLAVCKLHWLLSGHGSLPLGHAESTTGCLFQPSPTSILSTQRELQTQRQGSAGWFICCFMLALGPGLVRTAIFTRNEF